MKGAGPPKFGERGSPFQLGETYVAAADLVLLPVDMGARGETGEAFRRRFWDAYFARFSIRDWTRVAL